MKRIILTIAAVFAFGFVNAQDKSASSDAIKFGVKAGFQSTNFTGDGNPDARAGFYFGGLADFTVSEKFHVQPELMFSGEGADNAGIGYLRLPVMAKYYLMEGLNIQAGPEVALKIDADNTIDDLTKSVDFGLGFGAGYEMANGIMFDARYNLGLSNIADYDNGDLKNTGFQIGIGYRF